MRRGNILDITVIAVIFLFFAIHAIFNILFEEWIKHQLQAYLGVTSAEIIERFGAVGLPLLVAIGIVWAVIRLVRRDYDSQLQQLRETHAAELAAIRNNYEARLLEGQSRRPLTITLRVVTEERLHGIVYRYWVDVHNPSPVHSAMSVVLLADDSLIVENTIEPAWGNKRVQSTNRIDPLSTWSIELFGMPDDSNATSDPRDVFNYPHRFTLRASAIDTSESVAEFEFDLNNRPIIRQMS